jgi:hypothetical protein
LPRLSVVVVALALSGCDSHTLTREPTPPLTSGDWTVVWAAAIGAGLVWTVLVVVAASRNHRPSVSRQVAAGVFVAALVVVASVGGLMTASELRIDSILEGDDCRAVPMAERPEQIIQLSCTEGFDDLAIVAVVYMGTMMLFPALLVFLAIGVLLWSDRRPWHPAVVATAGTFFAFIAVSELGESRPELWERGLAWTALVGAALAAVLCWSEVRRPRVSASV